MFEEYLQDAYEFFLLAQKASEESDARTARRYYRASVFYAAGAIEAFMNYVADSFAEAETLTSQEVAFLNDKKFVCSPEKGKFIEKTEYNRLEDKLKFLIRRFSPDFDFQCKSWSRLMEFKGFRDSLVHPRQNEDNLDIAEYQKRLKLGLSGIIETMNAVSTTVFKRALRKQILDLIPE